MTPAAGRRKRRGRTRLLAPLLAVLAGVGGAVVPVSAQHEDVLLRAEIEYNSARAEYQSRFGEWDVEARRWQMTLAEINAARRAGDKGREDAALQVSVLQSAELTRLQTRRDAAAATLEQKRRNLEAALDVRMSALAQQWATATPAQRSGLDVSLLGLESQYQELQAEREASSSAHRLVFWPMVQIDPRDDRADILDKVQFLDVEIENALENRERVATEIARQQARLDLTRRSADSRGLRDIFDAATPPVGSVSRPGTTDVPLSELPLEEQLTALNESLAQFDLMIEELRARQATFRVLLTTSGGGVP